MANIRNNKLFLGIFVAVILAVMIFTVSAFAATTDNCSATLNSGRIILENEQVRVTVDGAGVIKEVYVKSEGESYIDSGSYLTYLVDAQGATVYPSQVTYTSGNAVTATADVTYSDGTELSFDISVYDDVFTIQLADGEVVPSTYKYITVFPLKLSQSYLSNNNLMAYSYPLNINTKVDVYAGARNRNLTPTAYAHLDTEKAGIAFIFTRKSGYEEILQDVCNNIVDGDLMIKNNYGGPNYDANPYSYGNYVIVNDSAANLVEGWKSFYPSHNIDQLSFHQGSGTFRQGDFYFHNYNGSAAAFKESVSDPLKEAGIISCLHTYAFCINVGAEGILSDPEKQAQLAYTDEEFTLANSISGYNTTITINESLDEVSTVVKSNTTNSVYMLIDNEIIKFTKVDADARKLTVQRGMCGTTATSHSKGAQVRHFKSCFGAFMPELDSELYLEIARNTARAYIDGGFEAIYLDALDGIVRFGGDDCWYYAAKFVHEIFKVLDEEGYAHPLLEYSTMYPVLWFGRSRGNAWDYPRHGFKFALQSHIASNETNEANWFYSSQLGWYSLYPALENDSYGGFQIKYHYTDDVDRLGTAMIAYNDGISFTHLTETNLSKYPAMRRNIETLDIYTTLKKQDYFSESIKQYIRESDFEFQIRELDNGEYAFFEKYYELFKDNDLGLADSFTGNNPFEDQVPFIRIENHFTSDAEKDECYKLFDFDTDAEFSTLTKTVDLLDGDPLNPRGVDFSGRLAIKTRVYGNGKGGAILIRFFTNSDNAGYMDRIIPIDFEGWRDITLVEKENGVYDDKYTFSGLSTAGYAYSRNMMDFSNVTSATIYYSGDMGGVRMDDVYLAPHDVNEVVNPSVTVNGRTITFNTTLGYTNPSTSKTAVEYIEYNPETDTAKLYDYYGNATDVAVTVSDAANGFLVESGDYNLTISADSFVASPSRLSVTLGFTGEEVLDGMYLEIADSSNGEVEADRYGGIQPGDTVILNVLPNNGYKLKAGGLKINYTIDGVAYEKTVFDDEEGVFAFTMPSAYATVTAEFIPEDEVNIAMLGASIRIPAENVKQGLRFLTRVYTDFDNIEIIEAGTLIIPKEVLNNRTLTINTSGVLNIVKSANRYYSYAEHYFEYTGVLTDIPHADYDTAIVARGYVKYLIDGDTEEKIVYSNIITRSVLDIAKLVVKDETVSDEVKAEIQKIIDDFSVIGDNDGFWFDGWNEVI